MAAGLFLLFRNIRTDRESSLVWRLIDDLSRMSDGMYLAHIIVLNAVHSPMAPLIENAFLRIPAIALITFVITYLGSSCSRYCQGENTSSAKAGCVQYTLWGFVFAAGDDDVERSFGDGIGTVLPAEGAVESVG